MTRPLRSLGGEGSTRLASSFAKGEEQLFQDSPSSAALRCVVFDLDGCLWSPTLTSLWGETDRGIALHLAWPDFGGAPFSPQIDGSLRDRRGARVQLYDGVRTAFPELATMPSVAVGSRYCSPYADWDGKLFLLRWPWPSLWKPANTLACLFYFRPLPHVF